MRLLGYFLGIGASLCLLACSDHSSTPLPMKADSGFVLKKDAFAFENFATGYDGSMMNADLAARMFGRDKVCQPGMKFCLATPAADDWIESVNEAMISGRCEGFAVLSQLFFLRHLDPHDFGSDSVNGLKIDENYALQKEIAYWFATQLVPNAVENKPLMPRDALKFMADFMKEGSDEFYRIGMVERTPLGFGEAHSVTPIGFYQGESSGIYYVRVYDNNFPDNELHIRLDVDANTWEYKGANAAGEMVISGGESTQNPLYFAATAKREGVLACPFCKDMNKRTLIAHGASPLVKDAAGNMVGIMGGQIIEGNGGSVSPGFSMCINGVAPVVVSSNTPANMPIEVTLDPNGSTRQMVTIQGGSLGTVSVNGDLTSKEAAQLQVSSDSVSIQPGGSSTTLTFMDGKTMVMVTVSGDAGNVKVSKDPTTGKLKIDTSDAKGATVKVDLAVIGTTKVGDNPKTSYSFTGSQGDSSATINISPDGWDGKTPPTATISTDGAAATTLPADHCRNSNLDGDETATDCGGTMCAACDGGNACLANRDCKSNICGGPKSTKPGKCVDYWQDGVLSGDETDVDCGGSLWWQPCAAGQKCKVPSDCEQTTARAEGSEDPTVYGAKPYYYCSPKKVCTASPIVGGMVEGDITGVSVRLTPDGLEGDATIKRIVKNDVWYIMFRRTMVTDSYKVEVVENPSADTACWVSKNASAQTQGKLYFGPEYQNNAWVASNGFTVSCDKIAKLCANGTKDLHEAGIDCGGAECSGIGKYCAFGASCVADLDCGNPQLNAVCASMTCKKTYDVRGSLYTTVPVTISLTPGGSLAETSTAARTFAARTSDTSFAFAGTRVTGAYEVTATAPTGATCKVTNGKGDATGVQDSFVNSTSVSCTSCGNGTKEGKESDVDCGGADCVAESKLCGTMKACSAHTDCVSGNCDMSMHKCSAASCTDNRKNGSETDIDCGGSSCVSMGKKCDLTQGCSADTDCTTGICDASSHTCVSCSDGKKNGKETAADCGGSACDAAGKTCALTQACTVAADCASNICDSTSHTCVSCSDGQKNGTETASDCGGSTCVAAGKTCSEGQGCNENADCTGNLYCASKVCSKPASWSVVSATTFTASTVSEAVAVAAGDIWAAGDDVLAHYDGNSWSTQQPIGAGTNILAMFALPDVQGGSDVFVSGSGNIMQYWNGSGWFSVPISFTGTAEVYAIHGTSTLLFAVGSGGQVARYDSLTQQFNDEFGGGGGGFPGGPGGGGGLPPPTSEDLFAVFVLDDNHAWAVGANGTIIELNTGSWTLKTTDTSANLRSLWASAADDVWAVGDGGVIVHYDGSSWKTVTSGTANNLAWIWGDGAGSLWTVGASGTIRYDYGTGFLGEDSGTSSDLGVVFGFDTTRWAMGASTVLVERN